MKHPTEPGKVRHEYAEWDSTLLLVKWSEVKSGYMSCIAIQSCQSGVWIVVHYLLSTLQTVTSAHNLLYVPIVNPQFPFSFCSQSRSLFLAETMETTDAAVFIVSIFKNSHYSGVSVVVF